MHALLTHYYAIICVLLMLTGFYAVIKSGNPMKKIMGLGIFQTSVLLFYISSGYVNHGSAPILTGSRNLLVNPLPHVLMLTAIVVGVAVTAVGLAIAIRIKEEYKTVEEEELRDL